MFREQHSRDQAVTFDWEQTDCETRSEDLPVRHKPSILESISKVPHETHRHHGDSARLHETSSVAVCVGPF